MSAYWLMYFVRFRHFIAVTNGRFVLFHCYCQYLCHWVIFPGMLWTFLCVSVLCKTLRSQRAQLIGRWRILWRADWPESHFIGLRRSSSWRISQNIFRSCLTLFFLHLQSADTDTENCNCTSSVYMVAIEACACFSWEAIVWFYLCIWICCDFVWLLPFLSTW